MNWVVAKIRWILLASGAVTCCLLYAAILPAEAVDFLFDRPLDSALAQVMVASWASLVGLMGAMLIYGAFVPRARTLALTVAGSSKLLFLISMLARGRQYLDEWVSLLIGLDVVMVTLFTLFLIGLRRSGARRDASSHTVLLAGPGASEATRAPSRPAMAKAP